ncbi:MAG: sugar ABC transporter permease [Clostridia bacterium]|nr:sugar ABC transporter permease [Clostridia bacterium]
MSNKSYELNTVKRSKTKRFMIELYKQRHLHMMVIPAIVFFFIFSYIPMYGIIIAFKDYNFVDGIWGSPWVGLKHFKMFFSEPNLWNLFKNTMGISILKTVIGFPGPIIFALLLNELSSKRFKKTVQTISYLPHFVSIVVIVGMVTKFCSANGGLFNEVLMALHIIDEPVSFLAEPDYFWGILIGISVWQGIGWGSIIYCSAISGIDQTLYEAATIDGAGRFKKIWHVTLPGILPIVTIYLILSMSSILTGSGFDDIYLLRNNMTMDVSETISVYSYEMGIGKGRYSFGTAIGLFTSCVNLVLLIVSNYVSKKVSETSLW